MFNAVFAHRDDGDIVGKAAKIEQLLLIAPGSWFGLDTSLLLATGNQEEQAAAQASLEDRLAKKLAAKRRRIQDSQTSELASPERLALNDAQQLLGSIRDACRQPEFLEQVGAQPLQIAGLFMGVCEAPASTYGFGAGEVALRNMFGAFTEHKQDPTVNQRVEEIEQAMMVPPGTVFELANSLAACADPTTCADTEATASPIIDVPAELQTLLPEVVPSVVASLSLSDAQQLLQRINESCAANEFREQAAADPFHVAELFMSSCEAPSADFGFEAGEGGFQHMLAAVAAHSNNDLVVSLLGGIEQSMSVPPGTVLQIASSYQMAPDIGESDLVV